MANMVKPLQLDAGKIIMGRVLRCYQMCKNRLDLECRRTAQLINEMTDISGLQTQPVHAGIEFDMHWKIADAFLLQIGVQLLGKSNGIDLGFKIVFHE